MFEIEVNNRKIAAETGESIYSALKRAGIHVPTLCHLDKLKPSGACRICSVEVEGFKNLVPSCSYPVAEGMKIKTNSERAIRTRKTIVELLLANHLDDCLYCVRNGECQLQDLSSRYGVREKRYLAERKDFAMDVSSPAIIRDQAKCILCGKCVRVCEEIMDVAAIDFVKRGSETVIAPAFEHGLNVSSCINCGQCVMVCPTGALREQSALKEVTDALHDPEKVVVVQHAPALSVSLAEEFGVKAGQDVNGLMVNALRRLGFDHVFDTSFSADLTIMEEATELVNRIKEHGPLPMMTSCSPGWVKYVEQFYPELLDNLSTCKSPQQMLGAIIKNYFAETKGVDPENIYSVAIMPCTAKKFEANRPEMAFNNNPDIDAVLTTRELARLIKMYGIEFESLEPEQADIPFGNRSSAGKLFGGTGGVMEAALRTAHFLINGEDVEDPVVESVRGLEGIKETRVQMGDMELGVAVVNGLGNARKMLEEIKAGRDDIHFIEVMTCSGGCVAGGGQPRTENQENIRARLSALYQIDSGSGIRASHHNKAVTQLYKEYLGQPAGKKSHELLHTRYTKREVLL